VTKNADLPTAEDHSILRDLSLRIMFMPRS